ncbi:MAG: hypothetical protein ACLQVI_06570 [Polyangiaceae bacterium]
MPSKRLKIESSATSTPVHAATAVASTVPAQPAPAPVVFVSPPPPGMTVPGVPDNYVPATPNEFTAVVPRQSELAALPQAVTDLTNFTDYDSTLGATAPQLSEVQQSLGVGSQWSTIRQASTKFDGYASLQEGLSWKAIRTQMAALRPAFTLAANRDPTLVVKYAGLAKLLSAKQSIAQKGAATKKANKKAEAKGELPTHGKVGKATTKAAQKAALAEKQAAGTAGAPAATATATPAVAAPAAVATPASSSPAASPAAALVNGVVNGAGH